MQKLWRITTALQDIRSIPSTGIGSTAVTVNILTMDTNCGAPASAPESDGSFVEFRALDDPIAFRFGGRKRYDIPFNQDPFTPQTISIANTSTLGTGISAYIDNSGVNVKFAIVEFSIKISTMNLMVDKLNQKLEVDKFILNKDLDTLL